MSLKPLGNRILVKPDTPETQTDSGLVLPDDRDHVPVSGIVVAVGDGPARDAKIRAAVISKCIGIVEEIGQLFKGDTSPELDMVTELGRYKNHAETFDSEIHVGDRVVYPVEAGLTLTEGGETFILLNEDDVVVIATEEEAAA